MAQPLTSTLPTIVAPSAGASNWPAGYEASAAATLTGPGDEVSPVAAASTATSAYSNTSAARGVVVSRLRLLRPHSPAVWPATFRRASPHGAVTMLAPIPAGDCANVPHQIISMDAFRGD